MTTEIVKATLEDMKYVTSLAKQESYSVGFIPKARYEAAVTGERRDGKHPCACNDRLWLAKENGDPVGFLLTSFGQTPKVTQICIQEDARLFERGRLLLSAGVKEAKEEGRFSLVCGCATDLESNHFWQQMGWEKVGERKGIHFATSKYSDRKVNVYRYDSPDNPQLELFKRII